MLRLLRVLVRVVLVSSLVAACDAPAGVTLPENSRANTLGLRHLAFRVDNIAAMAASLRAAGVTLFSDPVRVPQGVVKFAAGDKTLLYFLDPDGVILELAEYR